jgi:hypothetical protein
MIPECEWSVDVARGIVRGGQLLFHPRWRSNHVPHQGSVSAGRRAGACYLLFVVERAAVHVAAAAAEPTAI